MHVKKISFEVAKTFWAEHLWPGRHSPIEPVSCINSTGEIDLSLRDFNPLFFGAFANSHLVGVVSFSQTSLLEARMRGICVQENHRGKGISRLLFEEGKKEIVAISSVERLWTMARLINTDYYGKLGFVPGVETSDYEFGPHNLMVLDLEKRIS